MNNPVYFSGYSDRKTFDAVQSCVTCQRILNYNPDGDVSVKKPFFALMGETSSIQLFSKICYC